MAEPHWATYQLSKSLGEFRDDWDRLNAAYFLRNPFFDSDFVEPLLKHFSHGNERLCVHRKRDSICGMLIARPARLGKWTLFAPAQAQIAPVLVVNADALRSLTKCLNALALELPLQDPSATRLSGVGVRHARTISVSLDGTFEQYWNSRSAELRKSVERRRRNVERTGTRYTFHTHLSDMKDLVEKFGDLESKGWKGRAGTALGNNTQGTFYSEVMSRFGGRGCGVVYELKFGVDTVAMQLAVRSAEMLVLLKTTYDERVANLAPGRLLQYLLLRNEFELQQSRRVEFYTDADQNALSWGTEVRFISHHMVFRNRLLEKTYELVSRSPLRQVAR